MNWTSANQQAYQDLFNLDSGVFSRALLEYRCGVTTLNPGLPKVVSIDELFHQSPVALQKQLQAAGQGTDTFLADYPQGLKQGRYLPYSEGALPFKDFQFELAVSVYPFFKKQMSPSCIIKQLRELIRVAKEVRIAPYQLEDIEVEQALGPLMLTLQQEEVGIEIAPLGEKFGMKNAVMLKFWANACQVR